MAADLEYVRSVGLSTGTVQTATYIDVSLASMSAYKDAVIIWQGFRSANDNDGTTLRMSFYHPTHGWSNSYHNSNWIYNRHSATAANYHSNNNPGAEISAKLTSHQTLYGWAQNGGMGCGIVEVINMHGTGSRSPNVFFQTGMPHSRQDSTQAHQFETTIGIASAGVSWSGHTGPWESVRFTPYHDSWRSPTYFHVYGRKFS